MTLKSLAKELFLEAYFNMMTIKFYVLGTLSLCLFGSCSKNSTPSKNENAASVEAAVVEGFSSFDWQSRIKKSGGELKTERIDPNGTDKNSLNLYDLKHGWYAKDAIVKIVEAHLEKRLPENLVPVAGAYKMYYGTNPSDSVHSTEEFLFHVQPNEEAESLVEKLGAEWEKVYGADPKYSFQRGRPETGVTLHGFGFTLPKGALDFRLQSLGEAIWEKNLEIAGSGKEGLIYIRAIGGYNQDFRGE